MPLKMLENSLTTSISLLKHIQQHKNQLAVLIDPEDFTEKPADFLKKIPQNTSYLLVGGSQVGAGKTQKIVANLKAFTSLPIVLFPGDYSQLTNEADAVLFLSLLSGRNPEYLIEQQIKAVDFLEKSNLEIIPTAYILVDGGCETAVVNVSKTQPIPPTEVRQIVKTALAGQFMGKQLIYLEAGSGAKQPVPLEVIAAVKKAIHIPLIVGGGIKTLAQREAAYQSGADIVVMGTAFEE